MSAPEHTAEPAPFDPTSSVEVWTSAKGTYQWKIKVRAQSNAPQDVREAFALMVELEAEAAKKYASAS